MDNRYHRHNRRKYSLKVHIVLVAKYRKQLLRGDIDDASLRTGPLPPPKGSGRSPNYVGGIFMNNYDYFSGAQWNEYAASP